MLVGKSKIEDYNYLSIIPLTRSNDSLDFYLGQIKDMEPTSREEWNAPWAQSTWNEGIRGGV